MVGKTGFEPATPWSQTKCSTKLSHFPIYGAPNRSRTHNLLIRSQTLYPIELWAHMFIRIRLFAHKIILSRWWLQLESNQRHQDFQSCALPTELWSHLAVPTGLEPAIPRVTGECDNRYTTEPFGCRRWIWTIDLWVMSPTSYQTALSCDVIIKLYNGGGRGIRTPAPISRSPGFQDRSLQPDLGIPP